MDLRRLRAGEWIAGVSGIALLIALFLPWYRREPSTDISAWEAFSVVDVVLAGVALLGIAVFVVIAVQRTAAVGIAVESLVTILAGVGLIVVMVRVLNVPDALEADRTAFVVAGPLATLGVFAGSLIGMRDERLSKPGRPTDATGVPIEAQPEIEVIPSP